MFALLSCKKMKCKLNYVNLISGIWSSYHMSRITRNMNYNGYAQLNSCSTT